MNHLSFSSQNLHLYKPHRISKSFSIHCFCPCPQIWQNPMAEPVLTMILVTSLWAGAMAQSSCSNVIISMSPCLNYITGNSSTPSSGCCTQLASVVRSQPQCLCQILNGGGSSLGIEINQTRALALPSDCNVQTPPLSRCNASSPADSPEGTPDSGNKSKKVPSTNGDSSYGTSIKSPFSLLLFLVFLASYAATFTST